MCLQNLVPFISSRRISETVDRLASEVNRDYTDLTPVFICCLKGSVIFLADFIRKIGIPIHSVEFAQVSTYGSRTQSSDQPAVFTDISKSIINNQHILIIEDIVDTGITSTALIKYIGDLCPASVEICTLLDKPSRRLQVLHPKYIGITILDKFVVGYGMDFDQQYRNLPAIYELIR
jgi:hypoxanthine phosphoribosyltransferase